MAQVNIDVAKEASVQAVNTKVGASTDTPSNTPTTMFSGIKSLISWFTNVWTAARAAKLDSIQTTLNTPDGNTLGAWLNYLQTTSQSSINLLNNATYGLNAIKTGLASVGGGASLTGVGATAYTSPSPVVFNNSFYCVGKFIAPVNGVYKITFTIAVELYSGMSAKFFKLNTMQAGILNSTDTYGGIYTQENFYQQTSIGQQVEYNPDYSSNGSTSYLKDLYKGNMLRFLEPIGGIPYLNGGNAGIKSYLFTCKAGEFVQIIGISSNPSPNLSVSLSVTYEP